MSKSLEQDRADVLAILDARELYGETALIVDMGRKLARIRKEVEAKRGSPINASVILAILDGEE